MYPVGEERARKAAERRALAEAGRQEVQRRQEEVIAFLSALSPKQMALWAEAEMIAEAERLQRRAWREWFGPDEARPEAAPRETFDLGD